MLDLNSQSSRSYLARYGSAETQKSLTNRITASSKFSSCCLLSDSKLKGLTAAYGQSQVPCVWQPTPQKNQSNNLNS